MRVLCIGSAVVDIAAAAIGESNSWQEKQRINKIEIQAGGDALNQSVRMADEGLNVVLAACLGKDANASVVKSALEDRGVCTDYLAYRSEIATGTSLVLIDADGKRHTFSVKGAHSELAKTDLPELRSGLHHTKKSEYEEDNAFNAISLASLFSMPCLEDDGLLEYLIEAKKEGILVFADLGSDKRKQGLDGIRKFLPYIDYFLPSEYDALGMMGEKNAEDAAKKYRQLGVKNVIIKCGERGCYYDSDTKQGWALAKRVKPVDTTGAGDCMVALFIGRILRGETIEDACRYACEGASLSTLSYGASAVPICWKE